MPIFPMRSRAKDHHSILHKAYDFSNHAHNSLLFTNIRYKVSDYFFK